MTSQLTVLGDTDGADSLSDLQPGDEFRYVVTGTVKSNDGSGVMVDVSGVESPDGEDMMEDESDDTESEDMGPPGKGMMGKGKTPIAIIAIGGGPKK